MNKSIQFSSGFNTWLNKVKPPADATIFQREFFELAQKNRAQIRQGAFDSHFIKTDYEYTRNT
ncbi:hypothetical protein [Ferdinandcohnia sp. Marseille-Q9671]